MKKELFDKLATKAADKVPVNVTGPVLADLLGISKKRLANMVNEEKIPKTAYNSYELKICVKSYLDMIRARTGQQKDGIEAAKLEKIQRENLIAADLLIDKHLVGQIVMGLASMVVNQLEGLAPRIAADLAAESDPAIVQRELYEECRRIREAISREIKTDPNLPEFHGHIGPAPTKERKPVGG